MRRRNLLVTICSAAALWPLAGTRALQQAMPVIGYLFAGRHRPRRTSRF
jgi:hypothetical protein